MSLPFPEKLWRMVEDHRYDGIIDWNEDGSGFIVCDGVKFAVSKILVEYKFKSNNFISFLQQLSNYGFRKSDASRKPSKAYHHYKGYFKRDQHELLTKIMLENKELESDVPENSPVACGQHFSAHDQLDTGFETTPATATVTTSTQQHIKLLAAATQTNERSETGYSSAGCLSQDQGLDHGSSSQDQEFVVTMDPNSGPPEGGQSFCLEFDKNLPCSVVSAWAYFGDNRIKVWKTYEGECTMFGKNIPPGNQGLVTVKIKTETGDYLGETIYTYEDQRKNENDQSLPSKRKLEDFSHLVHEIVKVLKQFENGDDSKQNRALDSQQGRPIQEKELQPEKILKRLVYAAAEAGARELIEIIFSFSAGRIVFEAYKNKSSLPEDIAEDSGHKELAAYLRGITKRYSEEDSTSPGQSKVNDLLELANALEKIVLEQSEPSSDKDLRQMWEDDILETGYSGDGETSSSSSERENSDSDNEYKRIEVCKVPSLIKARGPRAKLAYENALKAGKVKVFRARIMLIGQDRAGKMSLKKTLLGLPFDPKEQSTEGIEVDPSKFVIDVDQAKNWQRTDENLDVSYFVNDLARMVAGELQEIKEIHMDSKLQNKSKEIRSNKSQFSSCLGSLRMKGKRLKNKAKQMDTKSRDEPKNIESQNKQISVMALQPYRDEELNFFKFSSIVLNEFPKALRQTFKTMWDNNFGHRPGFQLWDDSTAVRHLFVSTEGGATKVPTQYSYTEWDCTALFQATIFAQSFALHGKTLSDLYVKPRSVPPGSFHASVVSQGGNNAETFAIAIDQLRRLRNSLLLSTSSEIDKVTFDQYVQYAKDAFQALGAPTAMIDAVKCLTESDFPTNEVRRLKQRTREETQAYIKFLEGVNSDIIEPKSLSVARKQKMERGTANKEDVALLEGKIDDLKIAQEERDDKEAQTYTKILESVSSDIDEIKQKVQCDTANKEYIAVLEQKISELKAVQDKRDALLRNSEDTRPSLPSSCLPSMVPNFTGRERECDEIIRHVTSASTRIVSIWGSPGFGKTSVAIAVGHSIQSKELPVCWLSLQELHSKADLVSRLLSFIRQPTDNQNATRNLSPDDELCQLFARISDSCVFILDNADDLLESGLPKVKEEVIELLQEILRRNENATFIVITRESFEFMDLDFQGHQSVRIRPLEEASSRSLVHELLPNASTSDCTRITQICGHVPLAIKLLCSSISEDNAQPSQFLKDFLESSAESIVEMLDNPGYPSKHRLQFLFCSSFRRLSESEKERLVSLSVLPERFDTEVAAAVLGKTRIITKKILQSLGRKSLLDSSFEPRSFTMHKLIQSFARERGEHQMKEIFLDSKARLCEHYVSLLDKLNDQFLTGHSMSAFSAFYEDKQNIVQILIDGCLDSETADRVFDVLVKAEMFLDLIFWTQSEATNFDLIYDSALKAASRYGKTFYYRRLLASKAFRQITWGAKGVTLQLLSKVNEIGVAAYPITSDEKAKYLCYFGICQLVIGETEIGVQSLQEVLSSMGKTPEQTFLRLVIFQILAVYYQVKNNLSSSTDFYNKALRESTAIGDEHLLVIPAIERTTVKTDERKVTQRCTDTLKNQPQELQIIYHVKRASQHFPDKETNKSLRDILLRTLNDVEAALPNGSPGLFSFHCVVVAMLMHYNECKDTVKSEKSQIGCNEIQQEQSAKGVEEYSASSSKLHTDVGEVQDLRDSKVNSSDALQLRQSATDIAVERFGEDHQSIAECYQSLGIKQHQCGDFTSALQSIQQALKIRCALFGEDHPSTAESYQSLGITQRALGDVRSALQSTQRALNIRLALFEEDNSNTADSYHSLGITQHMLGDFSSALQSTQRALNIRLALFGEDNSSTADSYQSLGATQHELGDFSSALQSTLRALNIRCLLFGNDHSSTKDSVRQLTITVMTAAAEEATEEEGEDNSSTADSYQSLGATQHELADFPSALQSTQRALNIRCLLFGKDHSSTEDSVRQLTITLMTAAAEEEEKEEEEAEAEAETETETEAEARSEKRKQKQNTLRRLIIRPDQIIDTKNMENDKSKQMKMTSLR